MYFNRFSCILFQFLEGATIEVDQIHTHMRPLLMMLGDYRSLTLNVVNRLTSVTRLFPNSFNDKFCDQMMVRNYKLLSSHNVFFYSKHLQHRIQFMASTWKTWKLKAFNFGSVGVKKRLF